MTWSQPKGCRTVRLPPCFPGDFSDECPNHNLGLCTQSDRMFISRPCAPVRARPNGKLSPRDRVDSIRFEHNDWCDSRSEPMLAATEHHDDAALFPADCLMSDAVPDSRLFVLQLYVSRMTR